MSREGLARNPPLKIADYRAGITGLKAMGEASLARYIEQRGATGAAYRRSVIGRLLASLEFNDGSRSAQCLQLARLLLMFPDNSPSGRPEWRFEMTRTLFRPGSPIDILGGSEWLLPFLFLGDLTCLVVPHDQSARGALMKLRAFGVGVPDDLSVSSFDNYLRYAATPVTTVDPGTEMPGYGAFHTIMGDLHTDAQGRVITAAPRVVRRG